MARQQPLVARQARRWRGNLALQATLHAMQQDRAARRLLADVARGRGETFIEHEHVLPRLGVARRRVEAIARAIKMAVS